MYHLGSIRGCKAAYVFSLLACGLLCNMRWDDSASQIPMDTSYDEAGTDSIRQCLGVGFRTVNFVGRL